MSGLSLQRWNNPDVVPLQHTQCASSKERAMFHRFYERNYLPVMREATVSSILDLGCGWGHFLSFAGKHGFDAHGVDISEHLVDACRADGLEAEQADVLDYLENIDRQFDCIVANDIIEHFTKPQMLGALKAIHQILKPGGIFIVKVPNMACPGIGPRTRYMEITHEIGFTQESLYTALDLTGFTNVRVLPSNIYVKPFAPLNWVAAGLAWSLHCSYRFVFMLHGAMSTTIFTKHIIGTGRKS